MNQYEKYNRKAEKETTESNENMIRINGKQQVIDMLMQADPSFRELILRNLEKKDMRLARELRAYF
jgi:hypothetical protein